MGISGRNSRVVWTAPGVPWICPCLVLSLLPAAGTSASDDLAPPSALDAVQLDQRLGGPVPLDASFCDETGATVTLADFARGRPTVLVPAYYRCPMLCTLVINTLVDAVSGVELRPGVDFQIIVFSIDPREQPGLAAEKKLNYLRRFGRNDTQSGWHFLTGAREQIDRVTGALGYRYVYDERHDQYAHPAAAAVLTADGRIGRYLLGLGYRARDLNLALVEASDGEIGGVVDQVLLRCFHYDPRTGRYGFAILTALRIGGAATVAVLAGAVYFLSRRRRARARNTHVVE